MLTPTQVAKLVRQVVFVLKMDEPPKFAKNAWFHVGERKHRLDLYLRYGERYRLDLRRRVYCLDVSSATAREPGSGSFTVALEAMEKLADERKLYVYLENVISEQAERLCAFYVRRGYEKIDGGEGVPCFWRSPK